MTAQMDYRIARDSGKAGIHGHVSFKGSEIRIDHCHSANKTFSVQKGYMGKIRLY